MSTNRSDGSGVSRRALLAAALAGALSVAASAYAAGSDVIKVGVIGCGARGPDAARNAMIADKGVRITAMGDLMPDRAQEKRGALKVKFPEQVTASSDECFGGLDAYKKVIECSDVVIIANAAKFHPTHMMAAIDAGKHVFVEKPHAIDPAGVRQVREACAKAKQKGLCVVSGLHSRYQPGYIETVCGDDVTQSLIHNLDRASWVLNDAAPLKCHGMGGRSTLRGEQYGSVFDHHAVVYEFPGPVRVYAFCRTIPGCYNESSSVLSGSRGSGNILRKRIGGETTWSFEGKDAGGHQAEHDELFKALRAGKIINNGDYMTRSTLIAVMGQISCYTGQEITWEQISNSSFCFEPKPEDVRTDMEPPVQPDAEGIYPVYVPGVTKLI